MDVFLASCGHYVTNVAECSDDGLSKEARGEGIGSGGGVSSDLVLQLIGLLSGSLALLICVHLEVAAGLVSEF